MTAILKEAWNTSQQAEDKREKIQALSLAKECYSMKLDLLTNATVVDDAIRFVSQSEKSKNKEEKEQVKRSSASSILDNSSNENDNKESDEPDYNEDEKSDKEGEEKQEEQTGEITVNLATPSMT